MTALTFRCWQCGSTIVRRHDPQTPVHCCRHPRVRPIEWTQPRLWAHHGLESAALRSRSLEDLEREVMAFTDDISEDGQAAGPFHHVPAAILREVFALRVKWQDWPGLAFQAKSAEPPITLYGRRTGATA